MKSSLSAFLATVALCSIISCSKKEEGPEAGLVPVERPAISAQPLEVDGLRGEITDISSGSSHSCSLVSGEIWCWGGDFGTLGQIKGVTGKVTKLVSGDNFSCALAQGVVWCWGRNQLGQLGRGTVSEKEPVPAPVIRLSGVTGLSARVEQACAEASGVVYCWGNKVRLGYPNPPQTTGDAWSTPVQLREISGVGELAVGGNHACVYAKRKIFCWGDNKFGQLGISSDVQDTDNWEEVEDLPMFENTQRSLAAGADHTCFLQRGERVAWTFCWGNNNQGQLAQGEAGPALPFSKKAVDVGDHDLSFLTAGRNHTCAIDGDLVCWGDNSFGQVGATDKPMSHAPSVVAGVNGRPTAISSGEDHSCAVIDGNRVHCWGSNQSQQLGRR